MQQGAGRAALRPAASRDVTFTHLETMGGQLVRRGSLLHATRRARDGRPCTHGRPPGRPRATPAKLHGCCGSSNRQGRRRGAEQRLTLADGRMCRPGRRRVGNRVRPTASEASQRAAGGAVNNVDSGETKRSGTDAAEEATSAAWMRARGCGERVHPATAAARRVSAGWRTNRTQAGMPAAAQKEQRAVTGTLQTNRRGARRTKPRGFNFCTEQDAEFLFGARRSGQRVGVDRGEVKVGCDLEGTAEVRQSAVNLGNRQLVCEV